MEKYLGEIDRIRNLNKDILQGKTNPTPELVELLTKLDDFRERILEKGKKIVQICNFNEWEESNIFELNTAVKSFEDAIQANRNPIQKNDALGHFKDLLNTGRMLLQSIAVVTDVDTSTFGDHVWGVKKVKFYYFDPESIFSLLHSITHLITKEDTSEAKLTEWIELTRNLALFLRDFYPGMVIKKKAPLYQEFQNCITRIGKNLKFFFLIYDESLML